MNAVIEAHLTCDIEAAEVSRQPVGCRDLPNSASLRCNDTRFRSMTEKQLADYMAEHPQADFRKVTDPNDGTVEASHDGDSRRTTSAYVDLQGVICQLPRAKARGLCQTVKQRKLIRVLKAKRFIRVVSRFTEGGNPPQTITDMEDSIGNKT